MKRTYVLGLLTVLFAVNAFAVPASMSQRRAGHVLVAGADGRLYAVGGDADAASATAEAYDIATGQWAPVAAPAEKRFGAGAVAVGNRIYLLGGALGWAGSQRYAADILVLDPAFGQWNAAGTLRYPRTNIAATTLGGKIYTVGGAAIRHTSPAPAITPDPKDPYFKDAYGIRITEEFDPNSGVSSAITSIPRRRQGAALVAGRDGLVYAIGGDFQGDFFGYPDFSVSIGIRYLNATVEALDPRTGQWQTVTRMRTPRSSLAAVAGPDGQIYTFGGATKESVVGTVERYDATTQQWQELAPMPTARAMTAAAVGRDGRIYVSGGRTASGGNVSTVEIYNPATNTWEASAPPPVEAGFDFAKIETAFLGAEAKSVSMAEAIGWRAGRCFDRAAPKEPLGGLLVGYEVAGRVKVGTFATDGLPSDYFDVMTPEKRTKVYSVIESMDAKLGYAVEANGYLASRAVASSALQAEYQVRQSGEYFLTRVLVERTMPEGNLSRVYKVMCFHKRQKL